MNKELKEKVTGIVKTWAKNNMCASCYSDTEVFVQTMENFIDCLDSFDSEIMQQCLEEVKFFGIEVDEEVYVEIDQALKKEAEYWLKDYYKHKKDYDPEIVEID